MKKITYRRFANDNVDIVNRENVDTATGLVVEFVNVEPNSEIMFQATGEENKNLTRILGEDGTVKLPQNFLEGTIRVIILNNGRTLDCESMICYKQENGRVLVSPDDFDYRTKFSEILAMLDDTIQGLENTNKRIAELETTIDTWSKGYDVE